MDAQMPPKSSTLQQARIGAGRDCLPVRTAKKDWIWLWKHRRGWTVIAMVVLAVVALIALIVR